MQAERVVAVMGTTAHILVTGDDAEAHADDAVALLDELERKWSRFLPTSEVSRMNECAGEHVVVSPETLLLVQRAIDGWFRTGGLFDPTVLPALRAAGYDRDFSAVPAHAGGAGGAPARPAPGCDGIVCDDTVRTVTMPPGVEFDAGGIGKGLAADLVSSRMIEAGAHGALVNVGGDLRARGVPPEGGMWDVVIADPARPGREVLHVGLVGGAVATSSRVRRRWRNAAGDAHHIVDPSTGLPARTPHATVTAVTGESWWAEVVAKATLVGRLPVDAGAGFNARLVTIDDDGNVTTDPVLLGMQP